MSVSDKPVAIKGKRGDWVCPHHPDSYNLKCGQCDIAAALERGRQKAERNIHELAFTYLKDGLSPEEAEAKARDNYYRLSKILS